MTDLKRKESRCTPAEYKRRREAASKNLHQLEAYEQTIQTVHPMPKSEGSGVVATNECYVKSFSEVNFKLMLAVEYQGDHAMFEYKEPTPHEIATFMSNSKLQSDINKFMIRARALSVMGEVELTADEAKREEEKKRREALTTNFSEADLLAALAALRATQLSSEPPAMGQPVQHVQATAPPVGDLLGASMPPPADKSGGGLLGGIAGVFGKNL
ncbi:hypothetical protein CYMTET_31383 [Cymbomonas tetramitiformis]|uniref:Uncharacterized protein n=2 Tax=Cymbomonas tetramitiformis TaxID=36881 RepID=A0AAE0CCP2_9CHLO|nr:hypothetical protein CYMTET_39248 [Cymbomonas tetramitiformis]KAK3259624.1 hypothetical protein CYMTET_31383 [Cymbomonas tetramitiformis]